MSNKRNYLEVFALSFGQWIGLTIFVTFLAYLVLSILKLHEFAEHASRPINYFTWLGTFVYMRQQGDWDKLFDFEYLGQRLFTISGFIFMIYHILVYA